ncbi:MAG: hypothetical protein J6B09_01720 [Clostridia bacterium]|nr:hypothetical protein [Clostridia bacterium]
MNKRSYRRKSYHIAQLICVLLLLSFLVVILGIEAQRNAVSYSREAAKTVSYTVTDSLSGYVFRDEKTLESQNNGPIEYLVSDGSFVKAGDRLANVYVDDTGTDKRQTAAALYAEIARLERALERDVIAWQLTYFESYEDMMGAISAGDLRTGRNAAGDLAATLERRSAFGDSRAELEARIAALRAEIGELVRYVDQPQAFSAKENGYYFSYQADGYEALFGTAAVEDLTPEGLERLLGSKTVSDNAIGKLVSGGEYYLAVPTSLERAKSYTVDAVYRVRMARGGEAQMRLSRIAASQNGEDALLIFYAEKCPNGMDLCRRQPVEIERSTVEGLRVPAAALYNEGDEDAVYVATDGVAARRRVQVLCREGGSCIVAVSHEEGYLREGEMIVITARSVYDGKELRR